MKKAIVSIILCFTLIFSFTALSACDGEYREIYPAKEMYAVKKVDVYREAGKVDKTIPLRFYAETPNVPYIGVDEYFTEFFEYNLTVRRSGDVFTYVHNNNAYLTFDAEQDILAVYDIAAFQSASFFTTSTSKLFLNSVGHIGTTMSEKLISLRGYNIDVHAARGDVYVPLTLLSSIAGGVSQYNVAYNGKAIYVLDRGGYATGEVRDHEYFGEEYTSVLYDTETSRPKDLVEYTYNQLCFNFDNMRGYTRQLMMGDNNLLSLGLDGALERFYPEIKAALLSSDKSDYLAGFAALMAALSDGGHTAGLMRGAAYEAIYVDTLRQSEEMLSVYREFMFPMIEKAKKSNAFKQTKGEILGVSGDYYIFNEASKTAYIGFDSFNLDPLGWNNYYLNGGEIPVATDTYAFIRSKLYKALEDGAENLVLDLTTNGGGSAGALLGIVGLLNGGKASYPTYNTFNKCLSASVVGIDIDLDGDFDEDDVQEAEKFKAFNVGVLTSSIAFSCGNLLPSLLKELGYKIIGERSGGGGCSIKLETTADGLVYVHSSYDCLSNNNGDNIDGGVPTDFAISVYGEDGNYDMSKFYDIAYVGSYLSTAYAE